jgi:gamma-glutamyltranspeptidase / glutathione hydrolase
MRGVVVAPQPLAAEVGRDILRRGGNAYDAAVAAAFVQTVTDPLMCGIGGMGVAHVRTAADGAHHVLSFYARFGSKATPEMWADRVREGYVEGHPDEIGYQAIMTPGTVAGLGELHRRWGSLPWADLVRPAAAIARAGVPVYSYIEDYFHYPMPAYGPTQRERFTATPEMARIWLRPDGSYRALGELLANPEMADTLEAIAAGGPQAFYTGEIGSRIAADLEAHGSYVTADDLANYRPTLEQPLTGTYRGYTIVTNQPPGGGMALLQLLSLLEAFPVGQMEHSSTAHVDLLVRAMKQVFADRDTFAGDPAFVDVDLDTLLSPEHIADLRNRMSSLAPTGTESSPGTTHLTVYDETGNCVAITHTLAAGSGVITPGLGFQYNDAADHCDPVPGRPNSIAPGKARLSAMAPTIVLKDGKPFLMLGSPGSNAIINAVAQVIMNVVDFGMTPVEAVSAPRVHCEGGAATLESRFLPAVVAALRESGHEVTVRPRAYDTLQGRVQLVRVEPDGRFTGASDPRRDGGVAAYS